MTGRVVWVVAAVLLLEVGFFGYRHRDLVLLNRSADALVADAAFPDRARTALARSRVNRRVLERIAEVAGRRDDHTLQLAALDRIAMDTPGDASVQFRRADTLRAMGRHSEAERVYRVQLAHGIELGERP